jgi:hypothetical protein
MRRVQALPPTGAHRSATDQPKDERVASVVSAPTRDAKMWTNNHNLPLQLWCFFKLG